jgi:hypothetical protein
MKKALIILIVLCSCNSVELLDNSIEKLEIDKLKYTDCYIEIRNEQGTSKFDTVRSIRQKIDSFGNLRYEVLQYEIDSEKYINEIYYTKDKVDFLTTTKSENFNEYSEVFFNQNLEIVELLSTGDYEGKLDTLRMFYDYSYYKSKNVKTLIMTSEDNLSSHTINYDKSKNKISEYTTYEQDTVERKKYIYFEDKIKRIEILRTVGDSLSTTQFYNQSELNDSTIVSKIINGKNITVQKTYFEFDNNDNHIQTTVIKLPENKTEITKRMKKSCD